MQNDPESNDYIKSRFDFYQGAFRWAAAIALVAAIGVTGEIWKEVYDHMHPAAPPVFGLYPDGRLQQALVLDQPVLEDVALKQWTERSVLRTCNIDWIHYGDQLNTASDALLPEAQDGLKAEMEAKNITKELKTDRLIEDCSLSGPSWIAKKGMVNGALYYEIKMPLLTRFNGQSEQRDRTLREMVRVIVLQVPRSVKPRGYGISAIQVEPEKPPVDGE